MSTLQFQGILHKTDFLCRKTRVHKCADMQPNNHAPSNKTFARESAAESLGNKLQTFSFPLFNRCQTEHVFLICRTVPVVWFVQLEWTLNTWSVSASLPLCNSCFFICTNISKNSWKSRVPFTFSSTCDKKWQATHRGNDSATQ
jgi:hypothetical protein